MKRNHLKQLMLALSVTAAAALLGITVFLWGTAYKCSLYPGHPKNHARVAVAKLLSERERPVGANQVNLVQAPLSRAVFFALGLALFGVNEGFAQPWIAAPLRRRTMRSRRACCVSHFSFRPPPSLA